MGTSSMSGWAVFTFLTGFMLFGTFFIGSMLPGFIGLALVIASIPMFAKAKALEA